MPAEQPHGLDDHRRTAVPGRAARLPAELRQPIEQILDRPLPHAGGAVDAELTAPETERGNEEPHRGPGVADVQIGAFSRDGATAAGDDEALGVRVFPHLDPELPPRLGHVMGIVAEQHAVECGLARRASAAISSARLVILFEPGTRTSQSGGCARGVTV